MRVSLWLRSWEKTRVFLFRALVICAFCQRSCQLYWQQAEEHEVFFYAIPLAFKNRVLALVVIPSQRKCLPSMLCYSSCQSKVSLCKSYKILSTSVTTHFVFSGCGCNPLTTTADICEDYLGSYRCLCKANFQGFFCGQCRPGYFGFPVCQSECVKCITIE